MKITLITGMSGTGKSTLITDLASRDHKATDLDTEAFSIWVDATGEDDDEVQPGKDWIWNERPVRCGIYLKHVGMY